MLWRSFWHLRHEGSPEFTDRLFPTSIRLTCASEGIFAVNSLGIWQNSVDPFVLVSEKVFSSLIFRELPWKTATGKRCCAILIDTCFLFTKIGYDHRRQMARPLYSLPKCFGRCSFLLGYTCLYRPSLRWRMRIRISPGTRLSLCLRTNGRLKTVLYFKTRIKQRYGTSAGEKKFQPQIFWLTRPGNPQQRLFYDRPCWNNTRWAHNQLLKHQR